MSGAPKLDGRRASELDAELMRRAPGGAERRRPQPAASGRSRGAILAVAARIGEEVTRRLDQAPAKQADNFYNAAGIGRDPARPATLPVAFVLADGAKAVLSAPGRDPADGGRATARSSSKPRTRIDLVPGTVAALRGLDAEADAISHSVRRGDGRASCPRRAGRRGGCAAAPRPGATKIQVDPVAGLQPGTLLQLGAGDAARAISGDRGRGRSGHDRAGARDGVGGKQPGGPR